MIYLDSSAIIKLIRQENETSALRDWLRQHESTPLITSVLGRIETYRAALRSPSVNTHKLGVTLGAFIQIPINDSIVQLACVLDEPMLRSLDAIHLATALWIGASRVRSLVTYDKRLYDTAQQAGIVVAAPA